MCRRICAITLQPLDGPSPVAMSSRRPAACPAGGAANQRRRLRRCRISVSARGTAGSQFGELACRDRRTNRRRQRLGALQTQGADTPVPGFNQAHVAKIVQSNTKPPVRHGHPLALRICISAGLNATPRIFHRVEFFPSPNHHPASLRFTRVGEISQLRLGPNCTLRMHGNA